MYIIDRVRVDGFRGLYSIDEKMHKDVNFFTGRNGTGKTTLINIISSIVQCKFSNLSSLPFSSAEIILQSTTNSQSILTINVSKINYGDIDTRVKFRVTEYNFSDGLFGPEKNAGKTVLDVIAADNGRVLYTEEDADIMKGTELRPYYDVEGRFLKKGRVPVRLGSVPVADGIKKYVNASWLSVNRAEINSKDVSERLNETTIDQKLKQIYNDIPRYFSLLDARASVEFRKFQETYFLSLLFDDSLSLAMQQVKDLPVDADKDALRNIFKSLQLSPNVFEKKLNQHFSHFELAKVKFKDVDDVDGDMADEHRVLIDTMRIHKVVEKWHEYQKTRNNIYLPKNRFSEILSGLYLDKDVIINERNAPVVKLRVGNANNLKKVDLLDEIDMARGIALHELSSGEKQLFIILGECLLQEGNPWVYIADEPELSLHMEWQLELVSSLRQINSNSQIIFATHSPEILGSYSDNEFDMMEICK